MFANVRSDDDPRSETGVPMPEVAKVVPSTHARGVRVGELAGLVASGCARIEQDKPQTTCCRTGFSCVRLRRHLRLLVLDRQWARPGGRHAG